LDAIAAADHQYSSSQLAIFASSSAGFDCGGRLMSRTKRLREEVKTLLGDLGEANTVEIFDHLNERFSWGATMNQVGNIMSKDSRFKKIGHVREYFRCGRYTVCVWALTNRQEALATAQA
jgi:hypothetical protein